jgi:hypothetical protein
VAASTCSAEILDDLVTLAAAIDLYHNMDMTFWLRKRKQRWSK